MGDSILKIYAKEKIVCNSKYFELDPSFLRAHLVKHTVVSFLPRPLPLLSAVVRSTFATRSPQTYLLTRE